MSDQNKWNKEREKIQREAERLQNLWIMMDEKLKRRRETELTLVRGQN